MQERKRFSIAALPILGEPSAAIEPSKRALDNPAFGQDNKPFGQIRVLDDLHVQMRAKHDAATHRIVATLASAVLNSGP